MGNSRGHALYRGARYRGAGEVGMEMQVICAWCGDLIGVKECAWIESAVSYGICKACLGKLNEVEIGGVSLETEREWEDIRTGEDETGHSETDGKYAMGPDASEWERTGLGEGEGIA